jgi:hypothetical protein
MKLARMPPPFIPPQTFSLASGVRFLTRPQLLTRTSPPLSGEGYALVLWLR